MKLEAADVRNHDGDDGGLDNDEFRYRIERLESNQ